MRRRDLFKVVAGSAAAWPFVAQAQQAAAPVIGFLGFSSPEAFSRELSAFQEGVGELGFVESRNVTTVYRWANRQFDQLPALASDLVRSGVTVIAATGTPAAGGAAKAATSTIPIVFLTGDDPVQLGLVTSVNRPGGNATGIYMLTSALESKRLELLHEVVPKAATIGVMVDPNSPDTERQLRELPIAARAIGQRILMLKTGSEPDVEAAFAAVKDQGIEALLVASSPLYLPLRQKIVELASHHAVPAIYFFRDFAVAGGLMSYGTDLADAYRQAGRYTGRILKGERPSDLPVMQSTKVEFVINLKTAKSLGLTIPIPLLGRADEVIE
jgi:putative tryptophan/tyrosine transport system substrate-binding protein